MSLASQDTELDSFPKLLLRNAEKIGDHTANREKEFGIWQSWTWREVCDNVHDLACGFAALGLKRGDRMVIVGDNRPHLYWSMVAAQAIGAIPVPLYQDSVAEEMAYVVEHAGARFAMVEDQEQTDKMLLIQEGYRDLETIIYEDERGMRDYAQDFVYSYTAVQALGRDFAAKNPNFFRESIAETKGEDIAIMVYTSGTTGKPKGVILSQNNLVIQGRNAAQQEQLTEKEELIAYLPMAWVGDNVFSLAQSYVAGFCVSCPESQATVIADTREIGPTYFFAPPRIFENLLTNVLIRMEDAGSLKRKLFDYFMKVARKVGPEILDGKQVGFKDRLLYALGDLVIYGPLKNTMGYSRIRVAYTAGEAIGPDIFLFYRALGINLKQIYGSTEASVFVTIQPDGEIKADTVGKPAKGVELQIAENGEVLFRSPGVFIEYYKNPEATKETKDAEGWVHTGDAGLIGPDGHLKIIDRAKDVGRLNNGTMFAPKFLENKLKFFPQIKEAVAFGNERDQVCAFVCIDLEAMGSWAERNNVPYASYQELAADAKVLEIIKEKVEQVNMDLANDPLLSDSQIHRFLVLHKELDADDGELTRTRKVRRKIINERYGSLIKALYEGAASGYIETEVSYEDGRKGMISADLTILDAKTFPKATNSAAA